MPFKRRDEPTSIEDERAALREQRAALEELKHELAERVAAVRERELELHHALAETGGERPAIRVATSPLPPASGPDAEGRALAAERRDSALQDRERALAAREAALEQRERELEARAGQNTAAPTPPAEPGAERLAEIEARLKELRDAEKLFLRTRDELAARSEAVAARERLISQKERELDDREDGKGKWASSELSEVEERLRRLEQQQQPGEQTLGFSGGLRKLQQGSKRPPQRG